MKREEIMKEARLLGHCPSNVSQTCPCDEFINRQICPCADTPSSTSFAEQYPLTHHARSAGCAAKISRKILHEVLKDLPQITDPRIVIGNNTADDAGVIMLDQKTATVFTIDIFTPVVDDPYRFGEIAAANSVSDIYAMGAKPETAVSFIGFPSKKLPPKIMKEILRGGIDKLKEAGIDVIGGHSINDEEIKCGFAVIGTAPAGKFISNTGAKEGDLIIVTKPLGNGIITFAHQSGISEPAWDQTSSDWMATLNKKPSELLAPYQVHSLTDITGFSLMGHLAGIVENSRIKVEIDFDQLPLLPGVQEMACQDFFPNAVIRNRESITSVKLDIDSLAKAQQQTLFCPETSGGLLVFIAAKDAENYCQDLAAAGFAHHIVGHVCQEQTDPEIAVVSHQQEQWKTVPLKREVKQHITSAPNYCSISAPIYSASQDSIKKEEPERGCTFLKEKLAFLGETKGLIIAGVLLGFLFVFLAKMGNPANMGFCSACFIRDTAGALGLHNWDKGWFIRPEIIGVILGAFLTAICFGEFKARATTNGLLSLVLGMFSSACAMVFLSCPWRAFGRLGAGDLTAISGVLGLIVGITIATLVLKKGYDPGRKFEQPSYLKWLFPCFIFLLLIFAIFATPHKDLSGIPPYVSVAGPASKHAPMAISLLCALALGFFMQRSRLCFIGAFRDIVLIKNFKLFWGVLSFLLACVVFNLVFGSFKLGFEGQPFAHNFFLLSFVAMLLAGGCFTFAGGCPGRQLALAGSGDGNAVLFILGMALAFPFLDKFKVMFVTKANFPIIWIMLLCIFLFLVTVAVFMRSRKS